MSSKNFRELVEETADRFGIEDTPAELAANPDLRARKILVDYVAANHPSSSFVFEGPYSVGICNGAIVTGYGYTLRVAP